jgi:hypothetical protein
MLRKVMVGFCFICIWFIPFMGLAPVKAFEGPKAFVPEDIFEFEPVLEGSQVVHEFTVLNRGDATLKILKIESG